MPELGFGAITDELKILNSDDASAPSLEASESAAPMESEATEPASEPTPEIAPSETQTESADLAQPSELAAQQAQDDDLAAQIARAYPQHAQTFEAFRNRLKEYEQTFGSVKGAREFLSQVQSIGGLEKIKELRTRKEQVDSVDKIYYGGNVEEKRQFLSNLHKQNPQAFFSAVTNGLALLTPEERSYIAGPHVTDQLKADLIWPWLEHINEAVQAGLKDNPTLAQVEKLLNQFAAGFRKYGLGPARQSEAREVAQRRRFHAEIGRAAGESLDSDIVAAINHFAPHISSDPQRQAAIVDQVHIELQNAARNDRHLRHVLENLRYAGMSRSVGEKTANLLASKLRPYVPYVVQKLAAEFPAPIAKPAATNGKAPSRNGASARKEKLTQRAADQMDFISVLNDSREGEARR